MIKNERQYQLTKARAKEFAGALAQLPRDQAGVHPRLVQAERDGLQSQLEDLQQDIEVYEALRDGRTRIIEVTSFSELPRTIIQARIAQGLTQRDLADRLGLKEQQVQRWEATDYATASLENIFAVVNALGVQCRNDVFIHGEDVAPGKLWKRLSHVGLDREFVLRRIAPRRTAAALTSATTGDPSVLDAASRVSRVFGWNPRSLFSEADLRLNATAIAGARFKAPTNVNVVLRDAYTVYAHYLATCVLRTVRTEQREFGVKADDVRHIILTAYGEFTFVATLRAIWDRGIPVLPLADPGAFHGATWKIGDRAVIVLKQRTKSIARWWFDLLHELYHALTLPNDSGVVDVSEPRLHAGFDKDEELATAFADYLMLNGRGEDLVTQLVRDTDGDVARFKAAVPRIAKHANVDPGALANYVAYRLSLQKVDWWGTATNLQDPALDPLTVVRDELLRRVDLSVLDPQDREILLQALQ
jgi:transcriptional regulator with XRE-family HTH domain